MRNTDPEFPDLDENPESVEDLITRLTREKTHLARVHTEAQAAGTAMAVKWQNAMQALRAKTLSHDLLAAECVRLQDEVTHLTAANEELVTQLEDQIGDVVDAMVDSAEQIPSTTQALGDAKGVAR